MRLSSVFCVLLLLGLGILLEFQFRGLSQGSGSKEGRGSSCVGSVPLNPVRSDAGTAQVAVSDASQSTRERARFQHVTRAQRRSKTEQRQELGLSADKLL